MKTKRQVERKLEEAEIKLLADYLPGVSEERQRNVDYDRGYIDALKWVLNKL
ncbi:MAG: hypothetical protein QXX08_04955 [Candidatus Bathyarchaeia archaeon]